MSEMNQKNDASNATMELYQQLVLDHNRKPRNFRKIDNPRYFADGYNPLCGDHYQVYVNADDANRVTDVSFEGHGCAISKASASIMTESLKGKSLDEVRVIFEDFRQLLHGDLKESPSLGSKLRIFSGIWRYPARVKCAALAWHAMLAAIDRKEKVSTE